VLDLLEQVALLGHQRIEVGVWLAHRVRHVVEADQPTAQFGDGVFDVLADGLGLIERGFLLQHPDAGAWGEFGVAVGSRLESGHDLEDGRLAGPVRADDADLGAGKERQRDVIEDDLVAESLAHLAHGVDVLRQLPDPVHSCA
jgi:hypothetical protein